jgi:hypothetical protein
MPVLLHAASEHGAVEDIQRGKQGRGAMPQIVVRHGAAAAFFSGKPGRVRSSAWIWLFSSIDRTTACSGALTYSPVTALSFVAKLGSLDSLNWRIRCGREPCFR